MRLLVLFLTIILLLQVFTEELTFSNAADSQAFADEVALHKKYHPMKINCSHVCSRRCSKASRKNVCMRACKTCCNRCHCVPPGTYGNKTACPCYARLKTHGHKPKCP